MILKLKDARLLWQLLNVAAELVAEVKLKVSSKGLSMTAIDPANVALVSFTIFPDAIKQVEVSKQEEAIAVNIDDLRAVLKRAGRNSVTLEKKEQENLLRVDVAGKGKKSFALALINIEAEEKELPKLDFKATVELDADMLRDAIDDAAVVVDETGAVSFHVDKSKNIFAIEAKGSLHSSRTEFTADEVSIDATESCRAKYGLEYLQKLMKGVAMAEKAKLKFATDYPLQLEIKEQEFGLLYVLAPRIETGE